MREKKEGPKSNIMITPNRPKNMPYKEHIYKKSDVNMLVGALERWKKQHSNDIASLKKANTTTIQSDKDFYTKEVAHDKERIADVKKSLAQARSAKEPSKKMKRTYLKGKKKGERMTGAKITKAELKQSNNVAMSKLDMFEKSNPDLFKKTSPKRKVAVKRKKIAPGTKKIANSVKTASTKVAAVRKSLTILQKNVKTLLAEFNKKDAKKAKSVAKFIARKAK